MLIKISFAVFDYLTKSLFFCMRSVWFFIIPASSNFQPPAKTSNETITSQGEFMKGGDVNTDVQIRVWMIHSAEISLRLQQQLSQDSGTLCLSVQPIGLSSEIDFHPERQIESHMKYNRRTRKRLSPYPVPPPTPPRLIPSIPLTSSRALVLFRPSPPSLVSKWSGVFKPKLRSAARYTVPIATSQTVLWLHYNPTVIKSKWNRDDKDAIFSLCLWEGGSVCHCVHCLFHFVLFHFLLRSNQLSLTAVFFHYFRPLFWTNILVMSCKKMRLAWSNDTVWRKGFHTQTHTSFTHLTLHINCKSGISASSKTLGFART